MAKESGIATPTADDLVRLDRKRKGKKLSNTDWESATDPDAKVARMKNGSTRLAYKPEHAVDLDTGVIVAAPIHLADQGDTNTLDPTLKAAAQNLAGIGKAPTSEDPCDLVTDKGYHSRGVLKSLGRGRVEDTHIRTQAGQWRLALVWRRGGAEGGVCQPGAPEIGRRTPGLCANVARWSNEASPTSSTVAACAAHGCAGRENLHKRYLIHVAGFNLGILMRALFGCGTPREAANAAQAVLFVIQTDNILLFAIAAREGGEMGALLIAISYDAS